MEPSLDEAFGALPPNEQQAVVEYGSKRISTYVLRNRSAVAVLMLLLTPSEQAAVINHVTQSKKKPKRSLPAAGLNMVEVFDLLGPLEGERLVRYARQRFGGGTPK